MNQLKDMSAYYLGTANGLLTVMIILGFLEGLFLGRWVFLEVAFIGWLVNNARREEPMILIPEGTKITKDEE